MEEVIKSLPNDKVVIICEVNDNKNNTYTIIPLEVSLGKIDDNNIFYSETGTLTLSPIENIYKEKKEQYYVYADSIESIKNNYNIENETQAMMKYFKDIASHLLLAVVDGERVKVYSQKYENISPEITGDINKSIKVNSTINVGNIIKNNNKVELDNIDVEDLEKYLKERIFNNDEIIEDICTTIAMNYSATDRHEVESMLSVGTTGSGKSETYRLISEYLGIPLTIYGCDQLTASGYVGKDMEDVLRRVYINSKGNIELANKSIVVFDEIDKIASRGNDVTDLSVQYELLKFLEGGEYSFSVEKKGNNGRHVTLDTSFMTVAGSGAFSDLFIRKNKKMGFASNSKEEAERIILTTQDFLDYGMISELMSRFYAIHTYKTLTESDLKKILTESLNSPLLLKKQRYNRQFGMDLSWEDEFIDALALKAYETQAGGRSISKMIASTFKKMDHELIVRKKHERDIPKKLILTHDIVYNPSKFNM